MYSKSWPSPYVGDMRAPLFWLFRTRAAQRRQVRVLCKGGISTRQSVKVRLGGEGLGRMPTIAARNWTLGLVLMWSNTLKHPIPPVANHTQKYRVEAPR